MWPSGERWFPLENMHFKAHRLLQLPLTHLMLSSLLWLYSSPTLANKKARTFSVTRCPFIQANSLLVPKKSASYITLTVLGQLQKLAPNMSGRMSLALTVQL